MEHIYLEDGFAGGGGEAGALQAEGFGEGEGEGDEAVAVVAGYVQPVEVCFFCVQSEVEVGFVHGEGGGCIVVVGHLEDCHKLVSESIC